MSSIRRLSDDVVRHIAAGEVIERPSSVLKELVENSLDAGASKIQVDVLGAGKKLLRVADDGAGLPPEDCRLAFERHATSKIASLQDLQRLATFGFRGEALFSIAAVSRTALTSCSGRKGWTVEIEGGRLAAEHEAAPVRGTVIEVRDLFFNTPARLKFLKSDVSERGHLTRVLEEAALANPDVSFSLKTEGRASLRLEPGAGREVPDRTAERVAAVLGDGLREGLLRIQDSFGVRGRLLAFLAPLEALSPSRNLQFFFVNRRPISSRVLQQALYRAYEPHRSRGRHPVAVVYIELPPDAFDVNVHPAKRELRFREDRSVFEALAGACSGALLRSKGIPTLDKGFPAFPGVRESVIPYGPPAAPALPELDLSPAPGPSAASARTRITPPPHAPRWFAPPFRFLGQVESSYLVFDAAGGLLVVDQHAAQERILFEKYAAELEEGKVRSQKLLLPLSLDIPASQLLAVLSRAQRLRRAGFEVEAFGKTTLQVIAAPALFHSAADLRDMIHGVLDHLLSEGSAAADVQRHALATFACKAAVKAHDPLGPPEALRLLEDLKDCRDGTCCPHGRPSMISLNRDELARRFKRPGPPPL